MGSSPGLRRFRLAALVLGLVFGLVAAELALRLIAPRQSEIDVLTDLAGSFEAPSRQDDCSPPAPQARLREIVVPSPHPDLVYELQPTVETCFEGAPVSINKQGVRRSGELARPKPSETHRILVLGDSHAFGWAIPEAATIAAQLEAALGPPVEVVNAGVPGYSAYQEAAWLEAYGALFEPDCVLVLFVANDMGLPHFLLRPPPKSASVLWDRVRAATGSSRWFSFSPNRLATFVSEVDMERVPERYRHMVGERGYREALTRLARWSEENEADLVNVFDYRTLDVDAPALIEFQRGLGALPVEIAWPMDPALRVSEDDPHLNEEGNARVVETLIGAFASRTVCAPTPPTAGP